jgi:hypothetical protein
VTEWAAKGEDRSNQYDIDHFAFLIFEEECFEAEHGWQ